MVTLEEMLPHVRPGGVYACEDVHGSLNRFSAYAHAFCDHLNSMGPKEKVDPGSAAWVHALKSTAVQRAVTSVHLYPFLLIFERAPEPVEQLWSVARGTKWQPLGFWNAQTRVAGSAQRAAER